MWWCESAFRSLLMGHGFHRMPRPHGPGSPESNDGFVPSPPVSRHPPRGQADELWNIWHAFLAEYGALEDVPGVGVKVSWEGHASLFRLTKDQLFEYVREFVGWRRGRGMSDGLGNGLPLPIMDSAAECLGPQQADYAEFELEGLSFRRVPGFEDPMSEAASTPWPEATWGSSTGPLGVEESDG